MDTNRIRQILVVAHTGNLRKAAEILHISHSGLSKSLKTLEAELGGRALFTRVGRGIALTDYGQKIVHSAPELLRAVDHFLAGEPTVAVRPFRVATFEVFSTYFLGRYCKVYRPTEPLSARESIPGEIEKSVISGEADVGITYEPIPRGGIDFLRVTRIRMGIFGLSSAFPAPQLANLPFAAPAIPLQGTPTGAKGLDGWPDDKFPRNIRFHVDMMESALDLCRSGLAVIFAPRFIVELHNATHQKAYCLEELTIKEKISVHREVYLVKRTGSEESREMRVLARALRQFCR